MNPLLEGKRVLITGGSTGLGAAISRRFAAEGALGVCLDIQTSAKDSPWPIIQADVRDVESLSKAVTQATEELGAFDIVIPNAGIVPPWSSTAESSVAMWDDVFSINARGVFLTMRQAIPHISDGGSVVITGSLNSWKGDPNIISYVASKHAVLGIVRSTAMDLGKRGIRVNAIGPGPVATEALRARAAARSPHGDADRVLEDLAAMTFLGRVATEDDVANTALFLASHLSHGITGQLLHVDCGMD